MSTKCAVQLTTAHWQKIASRSYYQIARHGQELLRRDTGKIYQWMGFSRAPGRCRCLLRQYLIQSCARGREEGSGVPISSKRYTDHNARL